VAEPLEETLPDLVVEARRITTPFRVEIPLTEVPRAVLLVDAKDLRQRMVASALDSLDSSVGVWVEKRTSHTSDPVIRGLSGGNVLALVDGNTLSTFWGEGGFAGDDMYGKIDPDMLERIEVVRGPSSVLYGSNALGGVINFVTRHSPYDYTDGGVRLGGRTRLTAGLATHAFRTRVEAYGASPRLRWLVGGTRWENGNTVDGSGEVQDPTGGEGSFANGAFDVRLGSRAELGLTCQVTDNDPVYRYYRPTQDNENQRTAVAATLKLERLADLVGFADRGEARLYYQDKRDIRNFYDAAGAQTQRGVAWWKTLQFGVHLQKDLCRHRLSYGIDTQTTWAESPDDEQFTITPVGGTPRKAAPDTTWSSFGAYVQDIWEISSRWTLTASARFDLFRFASEVDEMYVPPGGLDPAADEFTDTQPAFVGGLHAAYQLSERALLYGGWTRGFREFAPRFGATQHGFGVVVPSQLLDPVTADQFELGLRYGTPAVRGELVGYHTIFSNFQNLVPGTFEGQDWYDFDGDAVRDPNEDVYVTSGNGDAYVQGVELDVTVDARRVTGLRWTEGWSVGGGFAWNYGGDTTNDIPLRHTHPAWGIARLRYDDPCEARGLWFAAEAQFVRHYDRVPPDRLANDAGYYEDPQNAASGKRRAWGLPGYSVLDLRAGINLDEHATLSLGLENVFDVLYRPAHSRADAPGRNFTLMFELTF